MQNAASASTKVAVEPPKLSTKDQTPPQAGGSGLDKLQPIRPAVTFVRPKKPVRINAYIVLNSSAGLDIQPSVTGTIPKVTTTRPSTRFKPPKGARIIYQVHTNDCSYFKHCKEHDIIEPIQAPGPVELPVTDWLAADGYNWAHTCNCTSNVVIGRNPAHTKLSDLGKEFGVSMKDINFITAKDQKDIAQTISTSIQTPPTLTHLQSMPSAPHEGA